MNNQSLTPHDLASFLHAANLLQGDIDAHYLERPTLERICQACDQLKTSAQNELHSIDEKYQRYQQEHARGREF